MAHPDVAMIPRALAPPSLSLSQIVSILLAWRRFIAAMVVATTLLSVVLTLLIGKRYDATATLLADFQVNDPLTGREFPSMLANTYMATQIELIGSAETLREAVDRLGLTTDEEFASGYDNGAGRGGLRDYVASQLAKQLSVTQGRDSRFIYVRARSQDPNKAARIANAVAAAYIERQRALAARPAEARAERYRQQLDQLRSEVDKAQQRLTEFRLQTGLIDRPHSPGSEEDRLLQLGRELVAVQSRRLEAAQRAVRPGEVDNSVLNSELIQSLKVQLATLEARYAQQSAMLGPRHPEMIALQAQIGATRERLDEETRRYSGGARHDVQGASREEAQLQQAIEAQRKRVAELRAQQDLAARYERELDSAKQVYDRALANYDEVLFDASSEHSSVTVSDPAVRPIRHSTPRGRRNVALGLIAGLFFGVGGAALGELLARRIRCRDDIEIALGLPVLGELGARADMLPPPWLPKLPKLP